MALAPTLHGPRLNRAQVVEEVRKGKAYSHGVDAKGNPLVFVCSRNFDPRTRDLATALRATIYMVDEAMRLASETSGQIAIFYDRTDFSASKNLDLALIKAVVSTLSANYPERLAAVYLYPAGGLASMILRMVSPLMDPRTVSKVHLPTSETGLPLTPTPTPTLSLSLSLSLTLTLRPDFVPHRNPGPPAHLGGAPEGAHPRRLRARAIRRHLHLRVRPRGVRARGRVSRVRYSSWVCALALGMTRTMCLFVFLCVCVCVLSSGCPVCRPSDLCVCRVGTPPAR